MLAMVGEKAAPMAVPCILLKIERTKLKVVVVYIGV